MYPNVSRCLLVRGYTGIHRDTRVSQCIPVYLSVSLRLPFLSQKMIGMSAHKQFLSIQDCISGQNNRQRLNNCIAFFFGMQARPSLKTSSSKARSCDPSKLFHRKLAPAIPQNLFITDFLVFDFVLSLQVCFFSVFVAFWLQVERNPSFISWFHIDCGMVSM